MRLQLKRSILPITLILSIVIVAVASAYANKQYWLLSFVVAGLVMIPFFVTYERKHIKTREMMLIVMLIALAAVSRIPFAAIPSVLPMTFIIIISGRVLGAERGFMIGALSAVVSNIFLGQGPWTPWQMICWGMIGCTAGLLRESWWMKTLWGKAVFGFIAGLLFGWVMNLVSLITIMSELTWEAVIATYAAGLLFDLLHACTNVLFIVFFANSWIRILSRFKEKYGL